MLVATLTVGPNVFEFRLDGAPSTRTLTINEVGVGPNRTMSFDQDYMTLAEALQILLSTL